MIFSDLTIIYIIKQVIKIPIKLRNQEGISPANKPKDIPKL